jgi:competence protein ComEC
MRMRALGSAAVLVGFVVLARPTPSVVRAAGMGLLALASIFRDLAGWSCLVVPAGSAG